MKQDLILAPVAGSILPVLSKDPSGMLVSIFRHYAYVINLPAELQNLARYDKSYGSKIWSITWQWLLMVNLMPSCLYWLTAPRAVSRCVVGSHMELQYLSLSFSPSGYMQVCPEPPLGGKCSHRGYGYSAAERADSSC
jgi:hypothetical protein